MTAVSGLSVVIPCFNEADNIDHVYGEVVAELGDLDLELVFVDDGSTDGTLAAVAALAAADPRVQYISFTRNFGFEAAFSAGYRYARKPWILHLDADQQFPAAEARRMIDVAVRGDVDAVFGVRSDRQDPWLRRAGSAAFHAIARRLGIELPRGATAFRLVRAPLARAVVDLRLGTPYFLATVPRLTSRYTTLAVGHRARQRGSSRVNVRWLAGHAIGLFVSVGHRLTSSAAFAAIAGAVLVLLAAVASLTGLVGPAVAGAATCLGSAVALVVLALVVRHQVVINAGQARPRLFYVREATIPIDPEDLLFGLPAAGPPGAAPPGSAPPRAGSPERTAVAGP